MVEEGDILFATTHKKLVDVCDEGHKYFSRFVNSGLGIDYQKARDVFLGIQNRLYDVDCHLEHLRISRDDLAVRLIEKERIQGYIGLTATSEEEFDIEIIRKRVNNPLFNRLLQALDSNDDTSAYISLCEVVDEATDNGEFGTILHMLNWVREYYPRDFESIGNSGVLIPREEHWSSKFYKFEEGDNILENGRFGNDIRN